MLPTRLAVLVCYIMWSNISDDSYHLTGVDVAVTVVAASHSHSSCSTVIIVVLLTVTGSEFEGERSYFNFNSVFTVQSDSGKGSLPLLTSSSWSNVSQTVPGSSGWQLEAEWQEPHTVDLGP